MQTITKTKKMPELAASLKSLLAVVLLAFIGKLCNDISLPALFGVKVHIFQYFIFLAAFSYGPFAGMLVGTASCWITSLAIGNPYIIVGNALLGLGAGLIFRRTGKVVLSVGLAFACQILWILFSDLLLMKMPLSRVGMVILSLLIFDALWAWTAGMTFRFLKTHRWV